MRRVDPAVADNAARARPRAVAPKKVVLPVESSRPASKLVERAPERPPEAPAPPEQKDLSDVLADLRAEKGEEMPEPVETATASTVASAVAPGATGGSGAPIDPARRHEQPQRGGDTGGGGAFSTNPYRYVILTGTGPSAPASAG